MPTLHLSDSGPWKPGLSPQFPWRSQQLSSPTQKALLWDTDTRSFQYKVSFYFEIETVEWSGLWLTLEYSSSKRTNSKSLSQLPHLPQTKSRPDSRAGEWVQSKSGWWWLANFQQSTIFKVATFIEQGSTITNVSPPRQPPPWYAFTIHFLQREGRGVFLVDP